jgi:hypothetical protein
MASRASRRSDFWDELSGGEGDVRHAMLAVKIKGQCSS